MATTLVDIHWKSTTNAHGPHVGDDIGFLNEITNKARHLIKPLRNDNNLHGMTIVTDAMPVHGKELALLNRHIRKLFTRRPYTGHFVDYNDSATMY